MLQHSVVPQNLRTHPPNKEGLEFQCFGGESLPTEETHVFFVAVTK